MRKRSFISGLAAITAATLILTGCMSAQPTQTVTPKPTRPTTIEEIEAAQRQKEEERRRQAEEELENIRRNGTDYQEDTRRKQDDKTTAPAGITPAPSAAETAQSQAAEVKPQETAAPEAPSGEEIATYAEKIASSIALGSSTTFAAGWTASTTMTNTQFSGEVVPVLVKGAGRDSSSSAASFSFKVLGTNTSSLSRTIDAGEGGVISFSVKTDIHAPFDGYLEFYIDGVLQDKYAGVNSDWTDHMYEIAKGRHTIEWRGAGASDSYTVGITNSVLLADIKLLKITFPAKMSEDFESGSFNSFNWLTGGVSTEVSRDELLSRWTAGGAWGLDKTDSHGYVAKLSIYKDDRNRGTSTLELFKVAPKKPSALSFDYKMDLPPADGVYAAVYIDDKEAARFTPEGFFTTAWKKVSVKVPAGVHTIKFAAVSENGSMSPDMQNVLYLDNISLVPDETSYVNIYPKGLQETWVNGIPLNFSAEACRLDGSVRDGRNVSWSVSSGATITKDGTFTAKRAGTYTVTATIDGKKAMNTQVQVYSEDYIARTYKYNGKAYGTIKKKTGTRHDTDTVTFGKNTPAASSFDADGFFVLSGKVSNSSCYNYAYVIVTRSDDPSQMTWYMVKDSFDIRVWLRFGKGEYTVSVYDLTKLDTSMGKNGPEEVRNWSFSTANSMTFTVNNTADIKGKASSDGRWLLPSFQCQSDDFRVTNLANAILAEIGEDASDVEKLRAIHDWIIHAFYYDADSLNNPDRRKRQDAVSALLNGTAVCEGYTSLFTSLERYMGIEGRLISAPSMSHAWNNTWIDGEWRLVDVTYDDPILEDPVNPDQENYEYFLTALSGVNNDHPLSAVVEETAEDGRRFF